MVDIVPVVVLVRTSVWIFDIHHAALIK